MNQWRYFSNSFGKLLHPVLWLYSLVIVLSGFAPGLVFLLNNSVFGNVSRATTPQAVLSSLASQFGAAIVLGLIGSVFAIFGNAALIYLINKLELRERITVGMGLDGCEKIFQLIVVRFVLFLPNLLIFGLTFVLLWGQMASISLTRSNSSAGILGSMCGLFATIFLTSLLTSALLVGAERALVLEKMSIGQAFSLSGQLLATQIGDFIMIGLIFVGLSILIGILLSCVTQSLASLMLATVSRSTMLSGNLLTNPIMLFIFAMNALINMLATILGTSVWTLAYRDWRADRLPTLPRNEFDDQMA